MKVLSFSALIIARLYPPGNMSGTHLCQRLNNPRVIARPEGLYQWKIPRKQSGIEPASFCLLDKCLIQLHQSVLRSRCNTHVENYNIVKMQVYSNSVTLWRFFPKVWCDTRNLRNTIRQCFTAHLYNSLHPRSSLRDVRQVYRKFPPQAFAIKNPFIPHSLLPSLWYIHTFTFIYLFITPVNIETNIWTISCGIFERYFEIGSQVSNRIDKVV